MSRLETPVDRGRTVPVESIARGWWRTALADPRVALTAIVSFGVVLRLSEVASRDLWEDEAFTVQIAKAPPLDIVDQLISDTHPPLYYLLLHYWTGLFGDSELSVRAPSIILGAATVIAVYAVGRLLAGTKAALLAALLVALSTFHLNYSIEARMYGMLAFLATASFYFFLEYRRTSSWYAWIGYVAVTTALVYTHAYAVFVVVAQNAYVVADLFLARADRDRWKSILRSWVPTQLAVGVLFLPWLVVLLRQVETQVEGTDVSTLGPEVYMPSARTLLDTFRFYAGGSVGLALVVCLCLGAVAISALTPRTRASARPAVLERPLLLVSLWLVVGVGLPFVLSQLITPVYHHRQTIAASIAFFLLVAIVLARAPSKLSYAAAVCLLVLSSAYYINRYTPFNVQSWSTVARTVDDRGGAGDLLVFDSHQSQAAFAYYSTREHRFREIVATQISDTTRARLADAAARHTQAWLVNRPDFAVGMTLKRELARSYDGYTSLEEDLAITGLELTLFTTAPPASP